VKFLPTIMLNRNEIEKLKNDSTEYNTAIDDVLNLFKDQFKTCRIVHKKSGLFFNGFSNPQYNQGKNTLSTSNFLPVIIGNKIDEEIIFKSFSGHIIDRDGIKLVHNNIVYAGSEVKKILSNFYDELTYLPIDDFVVERDFKKL
jgi:hypothetical protein